jgi:hypothetical protein
MYRSRSGEPGAARKAETNHGCADDEWFGTMSTMTRKFNACAEDRNASKSASVPNIGSTSR